MFYKTNTRFYAQECKVGCFLLRSKKKGLNWSSRKSVGITIQLCDSEEEEFFVYDSMQIRPEKFDFGIE